MAQKTTPGYKAVKRTSGGKRSGKKLHTDPKKEVNLQKALYKIADAASAMMDLQEFYALMHRTIGNLMYARSFYVTLYDPITRVISSVYFADEAGDSPPPPTRIESTNKSLRGRVLLKGKTLHLSKEEIEAGRRLGKYTPMGSPAEDWIGVPLKTGRQVIGMLTIQSYKKGVRYDEQDVWLLEFVARHIAVALTRARAIDETRQRNAELQIINSVQEGLASKLDVQSIYELVGDKIRRTFNAQVVSIDTYDQDARTLKGRYYYEAGRVLSGATFPSFGFRRHVIENRQSILIQNDMSGWMKKYDNPVLQGLQPKSAIFIPMIVGEAAIGVISLQNNDQENAFTDADVRLLTTLANSMGIALENARLWEQEKLYRKALQRELEIGREIQAGFLPETLPRVKGWEIAACLLSAREVAGDFYDAFEFPDGNIGLVIADVCDKGVGAALFMTLFRSLIRAAANLDAFEHAGKSNKTLSARDRLQRAVLLTNNYIAETHGDSGMFATVFFAILDPRDGRLAYVNGGHEPPLMIRSGVVQETLRKTGPALGATTDCLFQLRETRLNSGDMLFAFTDGVPDCRNPTDELFGRDRLLAILQGDNTSAQERVETTKAELCKYIAGATQFDDITLLALRRC